MKLANVLLGFVVFSLLAPSAIAQMHTKRFEVPGKIRTDFDNTVSLQNIAFDLRVNRRESGPEKRPPGGWWAHRGEIVNGNTLKLADREAMQNALANSCRGAVLKSLASLKGCARELNPSRIRLARITTPQWSKLGYSEAKFALLSVILGFKANWLPEEIARCRDRELCARRRYVFVPKPTVECRIVGINNQEFVGVCNVGGRDIAYEMVRGGYALSNGLDAGLEREARIARRGLWACGHRSPPDWEHMKARTCLPLPMRPKPLPPLREWKG